MVNFTMKTLSFVFISLKSILCFVCAMLILISFLFIGTLLVYVTVECAINIGDFIVNFIFN